MYDSVICAAMFDAGCVCAVMYDAVCVTSLCELCAACYVYRVCVGFTSARMASPGDVVSLRSTRTVWMGSLSGEASLVVSSSPVEFFLLLRILELVVDASDLSKTIPQKQGAATNTF